MFVTSELTQLAAEATSLWVKRLLNVLPAQKHLREAWANSSG